MKNYVKKGQKLPLYGVGPMLVFAMGAVTAIGIILSAYVWKTGILEGPWALLCRIAGVLLIVSGLAVWFIGALRSDMDASIAENRLQTGGIYAWVRNPMYSGWWMLFGRYMLFLYGYKLFDILVQDQYIVITRKYYVQFYPETKECKSWYDRSFNTKNQMIRLIAFPFVCALFAWITLIIGR